MAASFFDQIKSLAPPEVVERLAGGLGESPQATGKALTGAALPAVLGGLEQQFGSGAGPARLLGLVKQQDPDGRLLENLQSGGLGEAEHVGQGVIGNLFGQRDDKVADAVAAHSGIRKSSAISLLSIAGAMVLGWLGQKVARGGLDATGLGSMLSGVRGEIGRVAPPGLAAAMGAPKVAEPAGTYAASAATGAHDAIYRDERRAAAPKAAGPTGLPRWLAWLIPAVIVLGLLAWLVSRTHTPQAPVTPTVQAPHVNAPTVTTPQVQAPNAPTTAVPTPQVQAPNANAPTTSPQAQAPNANAPATTAPEAQAPNANAPTTSPQAQAPNAQVQLPSGAHLNLAPNSLAYGLANYLGDANAAAPRRFTFQNMVFPTAGSTPSAASQRVLSDVATILRAYPNTRIEVQGFTDNTGSPQLNQALSQRRAEQVRTALTQRGVPADRVTSQGFGQTHPVASNDTAAGRAQNRRTDIVVVSR